MAFRIPSKTFLLGEYAVLEGGDALLLGHGPWFEAELSGDTHPFHPKSPAGKYLSGRAAGITFRDPHGGKGGFGGSGAEFVAAFSIGKKLPDRWWRSRAKFAWDAWDARTDRKGSGADILLQAYGVNLSRDFFLYLIPTQRSLEEIRSNFGAVLSLFHTGIKLATHEHLTETPKIPQEELSDITGEAVEDLRSRYLKGFAREMNRYGDRLRSLGLLATHSAKALDSLPTKNVLAAKGCGAMGSDVIAVLHQGAELGDWARANSLALVHSLPV